MEVPMWWFVCVMSSPAPSCCLSNNCERPPISSTSKLAVGLRGGRTSAGRRRNGGVSGQGQEGRRQNGEGNAWVLAIAVLARILTPFLLLFTTLLSLVLHLHNNWDYGSWTPCFLHRKCCLPPSCRNLQVQRRMAPHPTLCLLTNLLPYGCWSICWVWISLQLFVYLLTDSSRRLTESFEAWNSAIWDKLANIPAHSTVLSIRQEMVYCLICKSVPFDPKHMSDAYAC